MEKMSGSLVTDISSAGTESRGSRVKVVNCGGFFHGRCGTVPVTVNVRNDDRSPSKMVLFSEGGGC